MKEFFIIGYLCLINPITDFEHCAFLNEEPIKFYYEDECDDKTLKKVNEIGTKLTNQGFTITDLKMWCTVDKSRLNA